jgi:hypothetical protein
MRDLNYILLNHPKLDAVFDQGKSTSMKEFLPLPKGEGRGEGERDSIFSVHFFAPAIFTAKEFVLIREIRV